jgi:HlyD family secretion protein
MNSLLVRKVLLLVLLAWLVGCNQNDIQGKIVIKVGKHDYSHIVTANGILEALNTYSVCCPEIDTDGKIASLIPEGSIVQKGDTICVLQAAEIDNFYKEAQKNYATAKAEYNKSLADLNLKYLLLQSQVKTIEAQTAISKLDSTQLAFVSEYRRKIIQLEIKKAEIQKQKIESQLTFLKRINESELKKLKSRIIQENNNMLRAKAKLDKLVLLAELPGLVQYELNWNTGLKPREGDIVWNQMPIVKIPDLSKLQIKLTVNDTKYKQIENNQTVRIDVDAMPEIHLTGKVTKKLPVGRPISRESKIREFDIYCSIDTLSAPLQPGLSVTCDVIVDVIPDTLVIPTCALFDRDSTKIVYAQEKGKFVSRVVKVAKNNSSYAVISKGLTENDVITLGSAAGE